MLNPIYDFYMKRLPKPNSDPLSATLEPTNNYIGANPDNNFLNNYTNRIDYNYSDRHRFFLRWGWSNFLEDAEDWTFESERGLQSNNNYRQNKSGTVDWTYAKSAATVLNVSAAANFFRESMAGLGVKKYKPSDVGFPAAVGKYLDDKCAVLSVCQMPRVSFSGYSSLGRSFGNWTNDGTLTAKLNLSHLVATHTLRAGVDIRDHRHTATPTGSTSGTFSFSNTYTRKDDDGLAPAGSLGLSWAAFMMGFPTSMSIDTPDSSATSNRYAGWYGQDTWRVGKNLTLNLGLRFEWEGGPTERLNRMIGGFDPNAPLVISSAAQNAYAAKPLTERPASDFTIKGGSTYVGVKGVDRKLWRNELMWLPRLSAAWQFSDRMVLRGGYGVYFDTLNVLNEGINQLGFSRATSTTVSTDFGYHWLVGNPANGIVPIMDPFPVRSDGTRFDAPYRDALGAMAVVGRGFSFAEYDRQHPRVQRWRVSVQRQLSPNMMVEAAYWGQWGDRIGISQKVDYLDGKYWATGLARNNTIANDLNLNVANPFNIGYFSSLQTSDPLLYQQMSTMTFFTSTTIRKNQLLRPYPHLNGLSDSTAPIGKARTHVLEITFERRFSRGLSLNASYSRLQSDKWDVVENEFDRGPSRWYPTGNARPHRVTITGIYQLPAGRNRAFWRTGVLSRVFGEWQVAGTYEWQPGYMLSWGNIFYYGNIDTFERDVTNTTQTLDRWFDTGLPFEKTSSKTAAAYHVRVFPYRFSGVRSAPTSQLNGNIQRDFLIKERVTLQLRLDALNLPNYSLMEGPNTDPVASNFGKVTSQTRNLNRFMQIQARIRF